MREYEKLAKLMRTARLEAGYTQTELANEVGLHSQFVSNWERGLCAPPNHALEKLIKLLKINREELVDVMVEDSRAAIEAKVFAKKKKKSS